MVTYPAFRSWKMSFVRLIKMINLQIRCIRSRAFLKSTCTFREGIAWFVGKRFAIDNNITTYSGASAQILWLVFESYLSERSGELEDLTFFWVIRPVHTPRRSLDRYPTIVFQPFQHLRYVPPDEVEAPRPISGHSSKPTIERPSRSSPSRKQTL